MNILGHVLFSKDSSVIFLSLNMALLHSPFERLSLPLKVLSQKHCLNSSFPNFHIKLSKFCNMADFQNQLLDALIKCILQSQCISWVCIFENTTSYSMQIVFIQTNWSCFTSSPYKEKFLSIGNASPQSFSEFTNILFKRQELQKGITSNYCW